MEKEEAKEYYSQLGRVWCPALKDYVVFNSMGFRHLMRKRGKRRPNTEQQRRFALLPNARSIIFDPETIAIPGKRTAIQSTHEYGKKIEKVIPANFWVLAVPRKDVPITIVIRQFDKGEKHFFSIY